MGLATKRNGPSSVSTEVTIPRLYELAVERAAQVGDRTHGDPQRSETVGPFRCRGHEPGTERAEQHRLVVEACVHRGEARVVRPFGAIDLHAQPPPELVVGHEQCEAGLEAVSNSWAGT